MLVQVPLSTKTSPEKKISGNSPDKVLMLKAVIESFVDGIMLITDCGRVIQANTQARQICDAINPPVFEVSQDQTASDFLGLPKEIWRVCQALIESRELFPEQQVIPESEVTLQDAVTLRIRVKWLEFESLECPCMLVTLEDLNRTFRELSILDQHRYGLTLREREIWQLRLQGYTYREMASMLYISCNTVKKHLKNISSKRQDMYKSDSFSHLPASQIG